MRRTLLLALVLALTGCGGDGPTEPPPPELFVLTISGSGRATPTLGEYPSGATRYTCAIDMRAQATGGEAGDYAEWENAELRWERLTTGYTAVDEWGFTDLVDFWGSSQVRTGTTQRSQNWEFWWDAPFRISFTLRYWVSQTSEYRTAYHNFRCE
jgi:hypothetical protein